MKTLKIILLLISALIFSAGCDKQKQELNILTTVYPIKFLTEQLYNTENILSIYPDGADVEKYTLTDKQMKEYSTSQILIYNGLSKEQIIAKNLINHNPKLHIIDVAYGLKSENGLEELWLSPNYFLMLATTIKNNLQKSIENKYIVEEIESKYKELAETLSLMDAELRSIAKKAQENNRATIIASSNVFKYLNNYGFHVITLEDYENNLNFMKNNFYNKNYKTLFIKNTEEKTEFMTSLENEYGAKIISVNTMTTLTVEEKNNNETYLTIMKNYLEELKNATLGNE